MSKNRLRDAKATVLKRLDKLKDDISSGRVTISHFEESCPYKATDDGKFVSEGITTVKVVVKSS